MGGTVSNSSSNEPNAPRPALLSKKIRNFGKVVCLKHRSPVEYRWTLCNFSHIFKDIYLVTSPKFSSEDGTVWQIRMYPHGCTDDSENFVSLYITSLSHLKNIKCTNGNAAFRSVGGDFGYNKFMPRHELDDYNDELVIICKIICKDPITEKYHLSLELSQTNYKTSMLELAEDFGELLNNSELSDVDVLAADGKVFKVHKAVLAARSKVFLAMFRNNMIEHQTSTVNIEDFDGSVLDQMLTFIYTTKSEITDDNAKDVLLAADKYDIGTLKRECIDHLLSRMDMKNAAELLEFAEKYDIKDLKVKVQMFVVENTKDTTPPPN